MQRILLIGANSSVATSLARRYLGEGASFYFLARNAKKLAPLLSEFGSQVIGWACLDFTDQEANASAVAQAYLKSDGFDLVVIAHGYLGDQLKSEADDEEALRQIAVNYTSVVVQLIAITKELGRAPQRRLHIAVLTSVAGERGRPRNYTYGSAKGALSLYLQGLRSRLWGQATVTNIKLGPVDTPMTLEHNKNALFISSEKAALGIARAIQRKKSEAYVPARWWFIMTLVKLLPERIFQKLAFLSGR